MQASQTRAASLPCTARLASRAGSSFLSSSNASSRAAVRRQTVPGRQAVLEVACSLNNSAGATVPKPAKLEERDTLRLALPSKGRMAEDTLQLLKVRQGHRRCARSCTGQHITTLLGSAQSSTRCSWLSAAPAALAVPCTQPLLPGRAAACTTCRTASSAW
jgi:hypothetical protein